MLLSLALAACSPGSESVPEQASQSPATLSSIEIVDFAGLEAALAAKRGEGFLLNFWAIWCAPCVAELPELVEVAHAWRARGGDALAVSYDLMVEGADRPNMPAIMREFVVDRGIDLPVLIYDDLDFEAINERFDLPGEIPVTLAIDKHGKIVDRQAGQADKARFEAMMRKALGL